MNSWTYFNVFVFFVAFFYCLEITIKRSKETEETYSILNAFLFFFMIFVMTNSVYIVIEDILSVK